MSFKVRYQLIQSVEFLLKLSQRHSHDLQAIYSIFVSMNLPNSHQPVMTARDQKKSGAASYCYIVLYCDSFKVYILMRYEPFFSCHLWYNNIPASSVGGDSQIHSQSCWMFSPDVMSCLWSLGFCLAVDIFYAFMKIFPKMRKKTMLAQMLNGCQRRLSLLTKSSFLGFCVCVCKQAGLEHGESVFFR